MIAGRGTKRRIVSKSDRSHTLGPDLGVTKVSSLLPRKRKNSKESKGDTRAYCYSIEEG